MIKFKNLLGVLHSNELKKPYCKIRLLVEEYDTVEYDVINNYEEMESFIRHYGDYIVFSITAVEKNLFCIRIQKFEERKEEE